MSGTDAVPAGSILLDEEAVKAIRRAVLVGLDSYGEVDRLWGLADVYKRSGGKPLGELQPRHPTGNGKPWASSLLPCGTWKSDCRN